MAAEPKVGTIICSHELQNMKDWHVWTLLAAACVVLAVVLRFVWSFSRKTQLFPLKGRAPRFVVIQLIYFFMMNFIPVLTEVFLMVGVSWDKDSTDDIPMTRQFLKSIYFLFRMWCYLIYVHR
jgi:chromate transport protein ChrA